MDFLLHNGTLVDGTSAPPVRGDVLVRGDRIAGLGCVEAPPGIRVIDASGLIVAPGFIDAHSHSDLQVLECRPEKMVQDVTTEVIGNRGFSTGHSPRGHGLTRIQRIFADRIGVHPLNPRKSAAVSVPMSDWTGLNEAAALLSYSFQCGS